VSDDGQRVRLSADEARSLAVAAARGIGFSETDARTIADHLLDAELRGHVGLVRLSPLADYYAASAPERRPMRVYNDRAGSALVDGGNQPGMVVAELATRLCVEKARTEGFAMVGANNHRYSGLLSYYVERVATEGFVCIATATGYPRVAPFGGREARLGTNPLAFGFPTSGAPIIVDLATSAISGGELFRRAQTGTSLPPGVAVDDGGRPTVDPAEGLRGALVPWGGHRGSALAIAIQLLGLLCGMEPLPAEHDGWSFLVLAVDPSVFGSRRAFEERATAFAEGIRGSAPADGFSEVRMPFDRSRAERRSRQAEGIVISTALVQRLRELAGR
jgi:LDH2 family malate/lactate/ureidoglycolate dehydrogenase